MAGLALPCRCDGPFLPIDRWLGHEADNWARACPRRDHDGSAAAAAEANDHSFGPRLSTEATIGGAFALAIISSRA
jgi:hypothetical protein